MNVGDARLIRTLISRIHSKLPITSGRNLDELESDPIILATVNAIIELSRLRLHIIVNNLTRILDNISRIDNNINGSFEILQSQLYILKILSACMTHHWKKHRQSLIIDTEMKNSQNNDSNINESPIEKDPPPLEDDLARLVLNVLSKFLYLMAGQENVMDNGYGTNNYSSHIIYDTVCEIFKNAGRVIFYISSSNWDVVFAKIKSRIGNLAAANEDRPEIAELKLLECSNLNAKRLSRILQELCGSFIHLRKQSQITLATVLRKAIWNWIEIFPSEFISLCQNQKRLEGGPEILFDILHSAASESVNRKTAFWPLQTMLLVICPDILFSASMYERSDSDRTNTISKKVQFLETLKVSLKGKALSDVAALCYVDICKASTYVSKEDISTFRIIVPDIENDLKDKLFDLYRPFPDEHNINQSLMTDCLTVLFKLNPETTLNSLIPICLHVNAPNAFKLVLLKSCYSMALEEPRLPLNSQMEIMHSILASPLRKLFQDLVSNVDVNGRRNGRADRHDDFLERLEIIQHILNLYRADPLLAIVGRKPDEENQSIILAITECMNVYNDTIKTIAADTLLQLHNVKLIEQWGPKETRMQHFWHISSQITLAVAKQILDSKERNDSTKYMLNLLLQLLKCRNQFLKDHTDELNMRINVPDRLTSNIALEVALLVLLCSADSDIGVMAIGCFNQLCIEAQLTNVNDVVPPQEMQNYQMTIVENMEVYLELSSSCHVTSGRNAQQRRIRKLLRMMTQPTAGNLGAWEEALKRWKELTLRIAKSVLDHSGFDNNDRGKKSGFIGAVFVSSSVPPRPYPQPAALINISGHQLNEWTNFTGFLSALGGCCVDNKLLNADYNRNSDFVTRRISLVQTSDYHHMVEKFVQDMVDLLVYDVPSIREAVKDTLGNELSPRLYIILFRNFESIVSRFLEDEGPKDRYTLFVEQGINVMILILDRVHDASDNLYACDIGWLVLSFAKYLNKLGANQSSLKIKKRLCQLAESLMLKKEYINLRQEIKLRNKLLEIIIEWTSDYSLKTDGSNGAENSSSAQKIEKSHRSLDHSCLKTVVELLAQLPLQPPETHETDLSKGKSGLFKRYFSFFIKLLNRCRILEAIDSGTHSAKNNEDLQMLLSRSKEYVKDLGPLKDYTILALSNLLSANVESGLEISLTMGYHEDSKTRTAFMQVLTNILNQGVEFDVLTENAMKERYERLIDIFAGPDFDFASSLCEVCHNNEQDEVARIIIVVFSARNNLLPLMKTIIDQEVMSTENEPSLFRGNTMTTRLFLMYSKTYCFEYLCETLQPVLNELLEKPVGFSCEIDPKRLQHGESVERNILNLKNTAQAFINAICSSSETIPRFFNPAVVAPDSVNLCRKIENKNTKRTLVLVTRIIQHVANNNLFSANEPFLIEMNEFIKKNIDDVNKFLQEISVNNQLLFIYFQTKDANSESPMTEKSTSRVLRDSDRKALHKILYDCQERMSKDLQTRRIKSIVPGLSTDPEQIQNKKKLWDKLSTLLAQLGTPPETPKKESSLYAYNHLANNHLFTEFMKRHSKRNVEAISSRKLFYEGGMSKGQRPVFYYIANRLEAEATDIELLFYYMFRITESKIGRPFDILFDLTQFGLANEIQAQWLHEYIAHSEIRLPETTMQLDSDISLTFTNVTKANPYRTKQELFSGTSCQFNDVYHISEIEDISNPIQRSYDSEFMVKPDRGRPSLTFVSVRKEQIMQALKVSKARDQYAGPKNNTERVVRPSSVPGTLLNMSLLNIGSEDPNLRLAAYNLLVALSHIFNFNIGNHLLNAKGLCIPANNTGFILRFSEKLALSDKTITLEFFKEFFVGFEHSSTSQKHFCLEYMAPWLPNLAVIGKNSLENQQRTREIIKNLIEMTTKETEMYNAIQLKVWLTLKGVDELTNLIIDEFITYAVENGISSIQSETVSNTIVTLSSVNVRGKIIARLRKAIARTSINQTRNLTDNTAWPEIAILIRFNLMLSFNNRIHIQNYLPELFQVISLLVSTGPPLIRASVHGLIVNLVQSLCTASPLDETNRKRLTLLLTELSEPNFRFFFGLNNSPGNAFLISAESTHELTDIMPLSSLETIVQALLEVMICGAPSIDVSNAWRARWMGLVTSTAFQHNLTIQPRAFVILGCLAREEVDDDLLYQILVALKGALYNFVENDCLLIISIVMCLTKIVENLPKESNYLRPMFWLAMALVQIGHITIFPSAINLLQVVLRALDQHNLFTNQNLETVLLEYRSPFKTLATQMDAEAGISYEYFSFAVAAALLKGLKTPSTKNITQGVLISFLNTASKGVVLTEGQQNNVHSCILGYLAALLPLSARNGDMKELLWLCGIFDTEIDNSELHLTYYKVFDKLDIPNPESALLLISLMVTILQHTDDESEKLFLYGFLGEAAVNYEILHPKMIQIITTSDTIPVLDIVQSIFYTVTSKPHLYVRNQNVNQLMHLESLGFKYLTDSGSFNNFSKEKMKNNARLASKLVNAIL
nr:86_t:CDS:10 [Entrophospora candida]